MYTLSTKDSRLLSTFVLRDQRRAEALRDESYFKRLFVDAGALCWPNGLELSPSRLYRLEHGELVWGDFELCFPIMDLYLNQMEKRANLEAAA